MSWDEHSWQALVWLGASVGTGLVLNALLFGLAANVLRAWEERYGVPFRRRFYRIGQGVIPLFLVLLVVPALPLAGELLMICRRLLGVVLILLLSWLAIALVRSGRDVIYRRYDIQAQNNLKARAVHTQVNVLVRILVIAIGLVAGSSIMMMFENVRQLGTSLIASAGVIGIIIGFAAQRSIATLLAGLQIAITQPIRIDDVVIVDGEWGRIEEISLTYVVVRIWDLRRLIVPTSQFLEKSFQNWTRRSAELLATVSLHVDYSVPVERVREELQRILGEAELWDGKLWNLQVVNATERTVELRALMSAADASRAWDLRCHVRERLLGFLQANYPHALPKMRLDLESESPGRAVPGEGELHGA